MQVVLAINPRWIKHSAMFPGAHGLNSQKEKKRTINELTEKSEFDHLGTDKTQTIHGVCTDSFEAMKANSRPLTMFDKLNCSTVCLNRRRMFTQENK